MRAAVLSVMISLGSTSQVKLASQSAQGPLAIYTGPAINLPKSWGNLTSSTVGTMSFDADVDTGSFRVHVTFDSGDDMGYYAYILDGKAQKLYSSFPPDAGTVNTCQVMKIPGLPQPSQYVGCAEELLQKGKRAFRNQYVVKDMEPDTKFGPLTIGSSGEMTLSIDADGGMRYIEAGGAMTVLGLPVAVLTGNWTATEFNLGSPDASIFHLPAEWSDCEEIEFEPPSNVTKAEGNWLKCVQPEVAVVNGEVIV